MNAVQLALRALMMSMVLLCGVAVAEEAKPAAAAAAAEEPSGPQPFKNYGVVLINPDNAKEAILLIQLMIPGKDGNSAPQQFGVPIKQDASGAKLVQEFGVKGAKPDDDAGSKRAQDEALKKFVLVEGTLDVTAEGEPLLTVTKFEKSPAPAVASEPAK